MNNTNTNYADITVTNSENPFINKCKEEWGFNIIEEKWSSYEIKHLSFEKYGEIHVIKKILSDNNLLPVLVGMAGYSLKSCCNSVKVINDNIKSLEGKYSYVCWLFHGFNIKDNTAKNAYAADDRFKKENPTSTDNRILYQHELSMNKELAIVYDKIIRKVVGDKEIHLMGKCAGGGVVTQILLLNDIYNALHHKFTKIYIVHFGYYRTRN